MCLQHWLWWKWTAMYQKPSRNVQPRHHSVCICCNVSRYTWRLYLLLPIMDYCSHWRFCFLWKQQHLVRHMRLRHAVISQFEHRQGSMRNHTQSHSGRSCCNHAVCRLYSRHSVVLGALEMGHPWRISLSQALEMDFYMLAFIFGLSESGPLSWRHYINDGVGGVHSDRSRFYGTLQVVDERRLKVPNQVENRLCHYFHHGAVLEFRSNVWERTGFKRRKVSESGSNYDICSLFPHYCHVFIVLAIHNSRWRKASERENEEKKENYPRCNIHRHFCIESGTHSRAVLPTTH